MITRSIPHALLVAAKGAALALLGLFVLLQVKPSSGDGDAYESGLVVLYILGSWPWLLAVSVGAIMALLGAVESWQHASSKPRL